MPYLLTDVKSNYINSLNYENSNPALINRLKILSARQLSRKAYEDKRSLNSENLANINTHLKSLKRSLLNWMLCDLIKEAKLTTKQTVVLDLYLSGYSFRMMRSTLGVSHQAVSKQFAYTISKLRCSYLANPYAGWQQVYLRELKK